MGESFPSCSTPITDDTICTCGHTAEYHHRSWFRGGGVWIDECEFFGLELSLVEWSLGMASGLNIASGFKETTNFLDLYKQTVPPQTGEFHGRLTSHAERMKWGISFKQFSQFFITVTYMCHHSLYLDQHISLESLVHTPVAVLADETFRSAVNQCVKDHVLGVPPSPTVFVPKQVQYAAYYESPAFSNGLLSPAWSDISDQLNIIGKLQQLVPGMANKSICCPEKCGVVQKAVPIPNMVMHLNDFHHWTREAIADWLETLGVDLTIQPKGKHEHAAEWSGKMEMDSSAFDTLMSTINQPLNLSAIMGGQKQ